MKKLYSPRRGDIIRTETTLFAKTFLLELEPMVFGGGITVYILECLVGNRSTSSGNFARDRALEEKKNQRGL